MVKYSYEDRSSTYLVGWSWTAQWPSFRLNRWGFANALTLTAALFKLSARIIYIDSQC